MNTSFKIKDYFGQEVEVRAKFFRYEVKDLYGNTRSIPGIQLVTDSEYGEEPYATLTKSFGEFIGMKDCAYIDLNNCPFATELINIGVACDTGFSKQSGFCTYPLWYFTEDFLKEIGGAEYRQYCRDYKDALYSGEFVSDSGIEDEETSDFEQGM